MGYHESCLQPHLNTAAPAAVLNMPPSTRPRIAGSTAPPAHRGRGGPHYPLHPTPWGVQPNMPPSTRPRIAGSTAPPAHRGRGGDHTLFSTPLRGVSNPTCNQQDPAMRVSTAPPAHCGRGDHPLFSTPLS